MEYKIDKTKFSSGTFLESEQESKEELLAKTPTERLEMLEFLRSQLYEETNTAPRLKRSIEVVPSTRR